MIAASLEGVLAQRVVRKICPDCRMSYEPDPQRWRCSPSNRWVQ